MKTCLIKQPAGLGDIFYTQKIAKKVLSAKKADKIIWPIVDDFMYIKDYLIGQENIEYVKQSEYLMEELVDSFTTQQNYIEIDLGDAQLVHQNIGAMLAKYKLVNLSDNDWLDYFDFKRNYKRENELFYDKLNLKDKSKYILVNRHFGSPPNQLESPLMNINVNMQLIEMDVLEDFNIFDWCKVLENAEQIHTVETVLGYIIEKLPKCRGLNMYPRWTPKDVGYKPYSYFYYNHIRKMFKREWVYHNGFWHKAIQILRDGCFDFVKTEKKAEK